MIKKITFFEFTCDVCTIRKESLYTESVTKAKKELLNYGWQKQKKDKKLTFICPYCVEKSQNNPKKQQKTQQNQFYYAPDWYNYPDYYKKSLIKKEILDKMINNYKNYPDLYGSKSSYFYFDDLRDYKVQP